MPRTCSVCPRHGRRGRWVQAILVTVVSEKLCETKSKKEPMVSGGEYVMRCGPVWLFDRFREGINPAYQGHVSLLLQDVCPEYLDEVIHHVAKISACCPTVSACGYDWFTPLQELCNMYGETGLAPCLDTGFRRSLWAGCVDAWCRILLPKAAELCLPTDTETDANIQGFFTQIKDSGGIFPPELETCLEEMISSPSKQEGIFCWDNSPLPPLPHLFHPSWFVLLSSEFSKQSFPELSTVVGIQPAARISEDVQIVATTTLYQLIAGDTSQFRWNLLGKLEPYFPVNQEWLVDMIQSADPQKLAIWLGSLRGIRGVKQFFRKTQQQVFLDWVDVLPMLEKLRPLLSEFTAPAPEGDEPGKLSLPAKIQICAFSCTQGDLADASYYLPQIPYNLEDLCASIRELSLLKSHDPLPPSSHVLWSFNALLETLNKVEETN
eukprot:Protomagalhaensia_wolfi_Nauph_80__1063@NODE_161_length_3370_cov_129_437706_g122_i0_p2_GENE_NODE_161_length_3370_cov_129_437706_g122_i0NODE_161_length_3370_cov_129_437706_g122_i0_p2_ORF_typecomplete_len436_score66_79_NODE_161_length_3370_cov_129_437706_g122_i0651372